MNKNYMLDTNICSFIMREQPKAVLKRLEQAVLRNPPHLARLCALAVKATYQRNPAYFLHYRVYFFSVK